MEKPKRRLANPLGNPAKTRRISTFPPHRMYELAGEELLRSSPLEGNRFTRSLIGATPRNDNMTARSWWKEDLLFTPARFADYQAHGQDRVNLRR
jgi:hypothetical protein